MEEKDNLLYIPQGLRYKREYFAGYGFKEFQTTIIATILTAVLSVVVFMFSSNLVIAVLLFLMIPSTVVVAIVKNDSNVSVADQISFMLTYAKEQKRYDYVYQDEWGI